MKKLLTEKFFNRNVLEVAPALLGKYLVRRIGKKKISMMITEVEAYDGVNDKACHAHKGRTARTEIMFGPSGYWYVYLCYGMYWMLNVVTCPKDYPAAVLIRGTNEISGPGRITRALAVDKTMNTLRVSPKTGLWIEDSGVKINPVHIKKTPRIGVSYAGTWAKKPWRFYVSF